MLECGVGRRQSVRILGQVSRLVPITSGVPQGSHLGPILFLIFINDLPGCLRFAKCLMHADDAKIFAVTKNVAEAKLLQADLVALEYWSSGNGLSFNISKSCIISFSCSRSPIVYDYTLLDNTLRRAEEVSDLEVIFDSSLDFSAHIKAVSLKAARMLGFIRRSTIDFKNPFSIFHLYNSLVVPIISYNSIISSP